MTVGPLFIAESITPVLTTERPGRPVGSNEWLPDDVWNFVSRPDVDFAINALNDAADAVGAGRRKAYATNDQGQGTTRRDSGASYENQSRAQVDSHGQWADPFQTENYRGVELVTHRSQKLSSCRCRLWRLL